MLSRARLDGSANRSKSIRLRYAHTARRAAVAVCCVLLAACRTAGVPIEVTPTGVTPTVTPDAPPTREVRPRIEIEVSSTVVSVGDSLTITGKSIDIGLEKFVVTLSSGGVVETTFENVTRIAQTDSLFEIVWVEGRSRRVTVGLTAHLPGTARVSISANGEVHEGYPGPAYWGNASSEEVEITVGE